MAEISRTETGFMLAGDLTVDTVSGIYRRTPGFDSAECSLDLSGVTNTDSSGLALLVYWIRRAEAENCRLIPCHAPEQMKSLIRVSGLAGLLEGAGIEA